MVKKTDRKMERTRRHIRVRRKISGTQDRPRLCVYRSNSNLYVQIIDDVAGNTLVSASTLDKNVKTKHANKEAAKELGLLIAKKAAEKKIETVVFNAPAIRSSVLVLHINEIRNADIALHLQPCDTRFKAGVAALAIVP